MVRLRQCTLHPSRPCRRICRSSGTSAWSPAPEVGRPRLPIEVVVEHHLAHVEEVWVLHQILAHQATFVADLDRAVRAGLQEQLRVADAAGRDDDVLHRIEVQLLRGA